ncbi:MAG: hypothetical protein IJK46_15230 [Prevotella sp.]|nr:hypothetical protein [Prevotella sp.]
MRRICSIALMAALTLTANGQSANDNNISYSGTNSPYSQYGLGELADQASGFNRGMNGVGYGFREHNQVNHKNPAAYSALDSLTFLFDAGMTGQLTNFKEGNKKRNAKNADFDYVVAAFRAFKGVGVSVGLFPYSNIGYKYSNTGYVNDLNTVTYTNTYRGSGGFRQVFLGAGWEVVKNLSIGADISYIWGDYERAITNSYSDSYINTISKYYTAEVSYFTLDFGIQYTLPINKNNSITVGAVFSPKQDLNANPECMVLSTNSPTGVTDTVSYKVSKGLKLPMTIGGGICFNHGNSLKVGADYQLQRWGEIGFPDYSVVNDNPSYEINNNYFSDRHRFTVGGEYCKDENGRSRMSRMRYRLGASYTTPYLKINGYNGPKEISVSAGVGIPIINEHNNRSFINISAQWVNQKASAGMIDVNSFRINLGITFNERWFQKWKVE